MKKEKIIIVDKNDKIIGYKERGTLKKEDIYRVSSLWIIDSHGNMLLAKRHHSKDHHPGKWGPAVAGTVEKGESYRSNIIKEAKEELGLKNINPQKGPKTRTKADYQHFTQRFILVAEKEKCKFKIKKDEVEEIKWFSQKELIAELDKYPAKFLPTIKNHLKSFLEETIPRIMG